MTVELGRDERGARRRHCSTHSTEAAAKKALAIASAKVAKGDWQDPTTLSVGAYLDKWLEYMKTRVAPSTYERYRGLSANDVKPQLGRLKLAKLTPTHKTRPVGRPPLDSKLAALIVRMAKDNPRWGYLRIKGECRKLGLRVSATTVKKVLLAAGLDPAPRRDGPGWSELLRSQAGGILACDLFTVETVFLRTLQRALLHRGRFPAAAHHRRNPQSKHEVLWPVR